MNKNSYSAIDLHQHSKYSYEAPKATLRVKDILEYYRQLAETRAEWAENGNLDKKVAFSITDHDSSEGAFIAWSKINQEPEKYKGIEFIPGIEFSVNCSRVLSYPDIKNNDEKFVFKGMHLLAHAKPGREKEFFKRTRTISLLSKMVIDPRKLVYDPKIIANSKLEKQNKYISIGGQMLAARNLIFEKCKVKVPYDCYLPCVKEGATYAQIRDIFIEETYKYIKEHSKYFDGYSELGAKTKISEIISKKESKHETPFNIFPAKPQIIKDLHSLNKIDILEIPKILGDCATTCFAHPYTLKIHTNTQIPVKSLFNVDISTLPNYIRNRINKKLNDKYEFENGSFSLNDIMVNDSRQGYTINGDKCNIVAFQIFFNSLIRKGVHINGFEIQDQYIKENCLEEVLKIAMDKYNLAISFGSDEHFNNDDEYFFKDKPKGKDTIRKSYFDFNNMLCTKSSYFKLNRSGKEKLNKEENTVSFQL